MDDVVHTALDTAREAQAAAHVAVELVIGGVVDQRELRLVQGRDHSHALEGGAGQILVVDIDDEEVAVDLVVLLTGNADDAGTRLTHAVGVDEAGAEDFHQQGPGRIVEHLAEGCVEGRLPEVEVILLDILGDTHEEVFVVVEIVRLIGVDLVDQGLGVNALLDGVGHIFAAQDTHLLDRGVKLLDRAVQGIGPAHGLAGKGIETAIAHGAQPVGDNPSILHGGDQDTKRAAGGTGCGRHMPVFVLLRVFLHLLVHPLADLVLGQKRELVQILCAVVVIGRRVGLLEAGAVERNFIGRLHQLVHAPVLGLQDPVTVVDIDRLPLDLRIGLECIHMFQLVIQFIVSHFENPPFKYFLPRQVRHG